MSYAVRDAQLSQTFALPNGAAATQGAGFDLGHVPANGDRLLADTELVIECPATTTTELGDTQTITFSVESADNSGFSTNLTVELASVLVVTGAGGAGAAAASARVRLKSTCRRYVRVKATKAGASNASTKSATSYFVL